MSHRRTRTRLGRATVFFIFFALAGCSQAPPAQNAEGEARVPGGKAPLRLALVVDARDRAFDESALAGLHEAQAKLGAEVQVLQSKSAADYQPNLTLLANQEFDETFAVGYVMRNDLEAVAKNYPKRRFAIVDAVVDQANVTSLTFRDQEGSFLAGALAGMVTKTKTVGFLGGVDVASLRTSEAGFVAGVRQVDPSIRVVVEYVGSFDNVALGTKLAADAYDGGADVVYIAAGRAGLGAMDEVRRRPHVFAIGAGTNQDALVPGKILSSVVKHADIATFKIAEEAQALKARSGTLEFGLRDDGIGLTDFKYTQQVVGPARTRLATLRAAIIEGKIVPPKTRAQAAAFKPIKVR